MLTLRNDAIGTACIAALCALPGVKGVKWATPNPLNLAEARAACDPSITWVGGLAQVWAPTFYAVGARGFTSGLINVWPERSIAIHGALEASDYAKARDLIAEMRVFEDIRPEELNGTNVTAVKARSRPWGRTPGNTPTVGLAPGRGPAGQDAEIPDHQRPDLIRTKGRKSMLDTPAFTPHGKHLIAGDWVAGETTFTSAPASGDAHKFSVGTPALVDRAARAAEDAFWTYGYSTREERAKFLDAIADAIEARGADITAIGSAETGLPTARLEGERGRTTGQLRLFAAHIRDGRYLDRRHDAALPDRTPPRPDLKMVERPIGPVGVFGASNFPLAFSTAGGDTAAALAAGCPVVVKGHPAHPGTGELVAEAIAEAIEACGMPKGIFSLVQGSTREVGAGTGTASADQRRGLHRLAGAGRALFDLCASRPSRSLSSASSARSTRCSCCPRRSPNAREAIGKGWAGSLTMGAGQFCTNPGHRRGPRRTGRATLPAAAEAALAERRPRPC